MGLGADLGGKMKSIADAVEWALDNPWQARPLVKAVSEAKIAFPWKRDGKTWANRPGVADDWTAGVYKVAGKGTGFCWWAGISGVDRAPKNTRCASLQEGMDAADAMLRELGYVLVHDPLARPARP